MRLGHLSTKILEELSRQGLLGTDKIEALDYVTIASLERPRGLSLDKGNTHPQNS